MLCIYTFFIFMCLLLIFAVVTAMILGGMMRHNYVDIWLVGLCACNYVKSALYVVVSVTRARLLVVCDES